MIVLCYRQRKGFPQETEKGIRTDGMLHETHIYGSMITKHTVSCGLDCERPDQRKG